MFHFLADPDHEIPVVELARLLAPVLDETPPDVAMRIRRAQGWIVRNVEEAAAEVVGEAIEGAGLPYHRIEATPLDVARAEVERVKVCTLSDDELGVELAFGTETFARDEIRAIDLNLLGELSEDEHRDEQSVSVRMMVEALPGPFTRQRVAILDHRTSTEPMFHLFVGDPIRILRVERGCRFPGYASEAPGNPWIDYFLTLVHTALEEKSEILVTPETDAFWRTKEITCILCAQAAELEHRLGWIQALVRTGVWGRS